MGLPPAHPPLQPLREEAEVIDVVIDQAIVDEAHRRHLIQTTQDTAGHSFAYCSCGWLSRGTHERARDADSAGAEHWWLCARALARRRQA